MLLQFIKNLFSSNKEKDTTITEEVKPNNKEKKKVKLKAGSEEWLKYVARKDPYLYEAYLADQGRKRELKNIQEALDKPENRLIAFELVPKMQGCRNVRSYLEYTTGSYKTWSRIRNNEELKANGKCIVCGYDSKSVNENTSKTDCHEVWHYDINTKTQKLLRLESLCTVCHKIKHIDQHSRNEEDFNTLLELYSVLNDISLEKAQKDFESHLERRKKLDNVMFKYLDISFLKNEYEIDEDKFECHSKEFNEFINGKFKSRNETD